MKKIIIVLFALAVLFTGACKDTKQNATADKTQVSGEDSVFEIETPYCKLSAPCEFENSVETKVSCENPYTLTFTSTADNTELFSIAFGGETGNFLGTLKHEGQNIALYVIFGEIDSENDFAAQNISYQEGLNTIIEHLERNYDFDVSGNPTDVSEIDKSVFDIETKLVTLKYPNIWKNKVSVEVTDEKVEFSAHGQKLFYICFVECEGFLIGTYNGTPLYVFTHEIDKAAFTREELADLYSMQEDVNVIIDNLNKDRNFLVNVEK